jgi:hypothetical protein
LSLVLGLAELQDLSEVRVGDAHMGGIFLAMDEAAAWRNS